MASEGENGVRFAEARLELDDILKEQFYKNVFWLEVKKCLQSEANVLIANRAEVSRSYLRTCNHYIGS